MPRVRCLLHAVLIPSLLALTACSGPLATVAPIQPDPGEEQAPAPVAREEPAKPAPPPAEAVPEHLGTPASSKAAAPAWWLLWYRKEQLPEYAPQPVSSRELFKAAGGVAREVEQIRDALLA